MPDPPEKTPRFIVTSNYLHKSYVAERNRKNPNSWTCTCKEFLDAIRVGSDDKLCDHILEVIKQYKIIVPTIPKQVVPGSSRTNTACDCLYQLRNHKVHKGRQEIIKTSASRATEDLSQLR